MEGRNATSDLVFRVLQWSIYGLLLFIGIIVLWAVRSLIILLFLAFIVSSFLRLVAFKLSIYFRDRFGIVLSLKTWYVIAFILFYSVFIGVFIQVGIIFITELGNLLQDIQHGNSLQNILNRFSDPQLNIFISNTINGLMQRLSFEQTLGWAGVLVNMIPYLIFFVLASWYMLIDRNNLVDNLLIWLKREDLKRRILSIIASLEHGIGEWAKAQFILMAIIGSVTYVVLTLLGIRYALVLAVISGVLEALPTFGPILSSIPAIFVAFLEGGVIKAVLVIIFYFVLQQLENALIVPKVMNKVIGIHPFIAIIAIMVGQSLFGAAGGLLAIPFYVFVTTLASVVSNQFGKNPTGSIDKV